MGMGNFEGKGMPRHSRRHSAKTAEPIKIPFELRTRVGHGKHVHVLDGGSDTHAKGQFLGESTCPAMPDDILP